METKDVQAVKYKMTKAKERCMENFRSLHSHLQVLSKEDLKGTRIEHGFKRAFMSLFGQDDDIFTNESSKSGNDTDTDDADIRLIYDEEPMAENSVAKLLAENEHLHKENEHLRQTYKDLYDSIKKTRVQTKDHNDSLIVQLNNKYTENANLKAQLQEKVFAIAALKNELRKLKGNSVDTKHAKPPVLGKPVLQPLKNQSVVRQPNAFKSERPKILKPRFASQVDVKKDLSKPVTTHYLPKEREYAFAKPHHMITSSESRISSKNMPRFSSNDMVHNHYLDEVRKKIQERDRNSKTSVMPSASPQNTTNGSKPKPRSNNQTSRSLHVSKSSCVTSNVVPLVDHSRNSSPFFDSKHFVCSTCQKCVFNANHDAFITKFLKEVNSRAKNQSHKIRNSNKPVEQKSHTQKPLRHIFTRHMFSPNKTSDVYEKTSPRFDLSKVDYKLPHGSNVDISKIHECKQTLDLTAGTSINVQKKQRIDLSVGTSYNVKKENLRVWLLKRMISQKPVQKTVTFEQHGSSLPRTTTSTEVPTADMIVMMSMIELESIFGPLFDEYFNGENQVVSKYSAVTSVDTSDKRQHQPDSTSSTSTLATTVTANGNFDLWVPTGKIFVSCTSKADSDSTLGSNIDISKIHECKQTRDLSAGTSINVQKEQSFDLSAETSVEVDLKLISIMTFDQNGSSLAPQRQQKVHSAIYDNYVGHDRLESLFGLC
ncbi:hypothetical protein Tco_0573876 [Tanacetum coccineum]